MMPLRKATKTSDFEAFYDLYPGQKVTLDYLKNSDTYLLTLKGKLIGGYVIRNSKPLRYIHAIEEKDIRDNLSNILKDESVAEVTCLWLEKKYRKTIWSKILWLSIAYNTYFGQSELYLFATTNQKLRKAMGYPSCVVEFLATKLDKEFGGAHSYFFLAERRKTILGMLEAMYYFTFKPNTNRNKSHSLRKFKLEN